jgi:hypothetical protein
LTTKANDPRVRSSAAAYLGRYGRAASTAIPALLETLKDKDEWWYVRESAAKAVGMIGVTDEQAVAARVALREAVVTPIQMSEWRLNKLSRRSPYPYLFLEKVNRPHPHPLPQEREPLFPAPGNGHSTGMSPRAVRVTPSPWGRGPG